MAIWPSRELVENGHTGLLTGISAKLTPIREILRVRQSPKREQGKNSLGVLVREVPSGQERIAGKVHTRHNVLGAEGDLLDFGKVVYGVSVEGQSTDPLNGDQVLGNELGRVEQVEVEFVLVFLLDQLDTKIPLGVGASLDSVIEISSVEVGILAGELECLVPDERVCTEMRHPVVLDESGFAFSVDKTEGVNTETLHVSERSGDSSVREDPGLHGSGLGVEGHEIPSVVVGSLSLGDFDMGFGLDGVDQVDKLDGILDEEDRNVVSD